MGTFVPSFDVTHTCSVVYFAGSKGSGRGSMGAILPLAKA